MTTRIARTIAHALLRRIHSGSLTVLEDGRAQATFGSGAPHADHSLLIDADYLDHA